MSTHKLAEMRGEREIQRAHDILEAVFLEEVAVTLKGDNRIALIAALDALCWVLGHETATKFAENLANLERKIEAAGYRLEERVQ